MTRPNGPPASWSAPAKHGDDGAFERKAVRPTGSSRAYEGGVALRFPPRSTKTSESGRSSKLREQFRQHHAGGSRESEVRLGGEGGRLRIDLHDSGPSA